MKQIPPPPPAGAVSQKNHALRRERRAEIKQSGLRLRRGRYRRKTMLSGEKEERKINKAVPAPAGAVAKRQGGPMLRQTEKFKSTAIDMTSGPILGQLVAFALPLMLGNVFQMLYNTVDSVIVGNFVSKQALAAIGSTTMIVNMLVFFFNGFSTGAVVTIGQFYGAQKLDKLHRAVETTMAATFLLSLVFTVAGVLSVKPLLRMMSTPEDVFEDATVYLRIYIGGISGLLVYNIGSGILRAVGDSKRPLYFLILTSLINIVLDLLFVVVLKTGIAGAAVATILSQFLSAALILLLLTKTKDIYRLDWKELKLGGDPVRPHGVLQYLCSELYQLLRLGLHGGLEQLQQAGPIHHAAHAEHGHRFHNLRQPECGGGKRPARGPGNGGIASADLRHHRRDHCPAGRLCPGVCAAVLPG